MTALTAGAYSVAGGAEASGTTTTAVPYATISDIVPASSLLSKRIEMTALAPMSVAFLTSRSSAWRRVSSRSWVYSWISPPARERRPAMRLPEKPAAPDDEPERLALRLDDPMAGDERCGGDDHEADLLGC